jgi:hypothetical protein
MVEAMVVIVVKVQSCSATSQHRVESVAAAPTTWKAGSTGLLTAEPLDWHSGTQALRHLKARGAKVDRTVLRWSGQHEYWALTLMQPRARRRTISDRTADPNPRSRLPRRTIKDNITYLR